jgi:hypothetical protein
VSFALLPSHFSVRVQFRGFVFAVRGPTVRFVVPAAAEAAALRADRPVERTLQRARSDQHK